MWIRKYSGEVVLYAEMAGTADNMDKLNDLFDNFILGLED